MVWSEQNVYPFTVYDNNGNPVLIVDDTGLRSIGALYTTQITDGETIISLNANPVDNVTMNREGFTFNDAGTAGFTVLDYVDGEGLGFRDNSSLRGVYYDNDTGYLVAADSVPWTPEVWNNFAFQNGWGNWLGSYDTCGYKLDALGWVNFKGVATPGVLAAGTVIANLPVGYRPLATQQWHYYGAVATILEFQTNGNVVISGPGGHPAGAAMVITGFRYPVV